MSYFNTIISSHSECSTSHPTPPLTPNYLLRCIYHIAPPSAAEDLDTPDCSQVEPKDEELSNTVWVEVDDTEWTDEQLMDDARPGRRQGKADQSPELRSIVREVNWLSKQSVRMEKEKSIERDM